MGSLKFVLLLTCPRNGWLHSCLWFWVWWHWLSHAFYYWSHHGNHPLLMQPSGLFLLEVSPNVFKSEHKMILWKTSSLFCASWGIFPYKSLSSSYCTFLPLGRSQCLQYCNLSADITPIFSHCSYSIPALISTQCTYHFFSLVMGYIIGLWHLWSFLDKPFAFS